MMEGCAVPDAACEPLALDRSPAQDFEDLLGCLVQGYPLFWNEAGLPIGVQFAGRFGDEATLFRLAAQLEQARPWGNRRPARTE